MNSKNTYFGAPYFDPPKSSGEINDILSEGAKINISDLKKISLSKNLPVNVSNNNGENLIHIAIKNNNKKSQFQVINFIKYLVENNTNPDQPNSENKTPLHFSCMKQYDKITEYLLKIGCNPNFKDNYGMTPFHYLLGGKYKIYKNKKPSDFKSYPKDVDIIKNKNISNLKKQLFDIISTNLQDYLICLKKTINNFSLSNENLELIKNTKKLIDDKINISLDQQGENKTNLIKILRGKIETNITNEIDFNFEFPDIEIKKKENILIDNIDLPPNRKLDELIAISNTDVEESSKLISRKIIEASKGNLLAFEKEIYDTFNKIVQKDKVEYISENIRTYFSIQNNNLLVDRIDGLDEFFQDTYTYLDDKRAVYNDVYDKVFAYYQNDPPTTQQEEKEYIKVLDKIIMFNQIEINPDEIGKNAINAIEKYHKILNAGGLIPPPQQININQVNDNIKNQITNVTLATGIDPNPLNFEIPKLREKGRNEEIEGFDFKPIELISKNEIIGQIIIYGILTGLQEFKNTNNFYIDNRTLFLQFIRKFDNDIIKDPRMVPPGLAFAALGPAQVSKCVKDAFITFSNNNTISKIKFRNQSLAINSNILARAFDNPNMGPILIIDNNDPSTVLTILKSDTYNLNFVYAAAAAESIYYITKKIAPPLTPPNLGNNDVDSTEISTGKNGRIKKTIVKIFNDHPEYKPKIYESIIKLLDENKTLDKLIEFAKPNYPKYMKDFLIQVNENLPFLNKLINVPQEISISKEKNLLIAYQDPDSDYFDYSLDMDPSPTNPILPVEDYDFILRNNGEDLTINNIKRLRFLYLKNAQLKSDNSNSKQYIFNSYKLEFFKPANIDYIFRNKLNTNNDKYNIFSILVFVLLVPNIKYYNKVWNIVSTNSSFKIQNTGADINFTIDDNTFWEDELHDIVKKLRDHYNKQFDKRNEEGEIKKFLLILKSIDDYRNTFVSKCNNNLYKDIIYLLKYFNQMDYGDTELGKNNSNNYNNFEYYVKQFLKLIYYYENPNIDSKFNDPTSDYFRPEYNLPKHKFYYCSRGTNENDYLYRKSYSDKKSTNLINIAYVLDLDFYGKINTTINCLYPSKIHFNELILKILFDKNNVNIPINTIKLKTSNDITQPLVLLINNNLKEFKEFFDDIYHEPSEFVEFGTEHIKNFINHMNNLNTILKIDNIPIDFGRFINIQIRNFNNINSLNYLNEYFQNSGQINKFYENSIPLYGDEIDILEREIYGLNINNKKPGKLGNNYSNYEDNLKIEFNFKVTNTVKNINLDDELPESLQNKDSINYFLRFFIKKIVSIDNLLKKIKDPLEKILNSKDYKLKDDDTDVAKWYLIGKALEEILIDYTKTYTQTNINKILVGYFESNSNPSKNIDNKLFPIVSDNQFTTKLDDKLEIDNTLNNNNIKDSIDYYNFNKIEDDEDLFIVYSDDYSGLTIEKEFLKLKINHELVNKMIENGGNLNIEDGNNRLPFDNLIDNHYYVLFDNFQIPEEFKFNIGNKYSHGYLQYAIESYKNHINRYLFNKENNSEILKIFIENQYEDIKLLLSTDETGYNVSKYNKISFIIVNYLTNQYFTQHSSRNSIEGIESTKNNYDLSNIYHHSDLNSLNQHNLKELVEKDIKKIDKKLKKYNRETSSVRNDKKIDKLQKQKANLEKIKIKIKENTIQKNYIYDLKLLRSYNNNLNQNQNALIQAQAWADLFNTNKLNDSEYLILLKMLKEEENLEFKNIDVIDLINKKYLPFYEFLQENAKRYFEESKYFETNKVRLFLKELLMYCTKIIICPQIELITRRLLLDHYKSMNPNKSITDQKDLVEALLSQNSLSDNSPLDKLYELPEILVKNAINVYDNKDEKASFNNQSVKDIIEKWLYNLTISPYISISEDSKIYEILKDKIGDYFDSFVFKLIQNWTIVFENNLKFVINQYRILKVITNIIQ